MGLFEKKRKLSRPKLRESLRKASPLIPGGGGMFTRQERVELERKLFPYGKYGGYISKIETKKALRKLRSSEYRAKTATEKIKVSRQRRFLEKISDLKGKY